MKRALVVSLTAAILVACQGDQISAPGGAPLFDIKDGAHGGNIDVFFHPPLVPNPSLDPEFGDRPSNPDLDPVARVCLTATLVCDADADVIELPMAFQDDRYQVNWHTGASGLANGQNYRIHIFIGTLLLAYRDVTPVSKPKGSCQKQEFCQFQNGSTLPIKVRIETFAACIALPADPPFNPDDPNATCATASLGAGESLPLEDVGFATVDDPATINMRPCPDLRDLEARPTAELGRVDLRTFGTCLEIENLDALPVSGTATVCDAIGQAKAAGLSDARIARMTVHRFSLGKVPPTHALPHGEGPACTPSPAPARIGQLPEFNTLEKVARLARRAWREASDQLRTWLQPAPLWANTAAVCDRGTGGCGGPGEFESDFQVAQPAWMDFHPDNEDGDLGAHDVGTVVTAKVRVFDSGELEPVEGGPIPDPVPELAANVRLNVEVTEGNGTVNQMTIFTDANGIATFELTVGFGENTVEVTGIGVGTPDEDTDPVNNVFAPPFNDGPSALDVALGLGKLTITAEGIFSFEEETGWAGTGFWHRSTLTTNPPIVNGAFPTYVSTFDPPSTPGGTLPAPFAGTWVSWYGEEADGNYIGTQLPDDGAGSGGTSTAANSGSWTSPTFFVPAGGTATLRFNTWWEIEGVNPATFDVMRVSIYDLNSATTTLLGVLNPAADPTSPTDRRAMPFTSGGFNTAPVWVEIPHVVSAFAGKQVRLIFEFDTRDALYNGFRGWVVDNIRITLGTPLPGPGIAAAAGSYGNGLNPEPPPAVRQP